MKQLTITLTILLIVITTSNSCDSGNAYHVERPNSKMIAGKEKKELEAYMTYIDSLQNRSYDLPTDTSGFQKGSFICYDSLAMVDPMAEAGMSLAYVNAETKGQKLFKFSSFNDLKSIIKGEIRKESYKTLLEKLKHKEYLVVIKNVAFIEPKMHGENEFDNGQIISLIQVIDLNKLVIVKNVLLQTENSEDVSAIKIYYDSAEVYDAQLKQNLWQNYAENLAKELETIFH